MKNYEINIEAPKHLSRAAKLEEDKKQLEKMEKNFEKKEGVITNAEEIFGYMMRLFRKNLGLTQEEMGLIIGREHFTYSKAGYAKLERGESGINIECIFHLSNLTGLNHVTIFCLYDEIINAIFHNKIKPVHFYPIIGHYGMGTFPLKTIKILEEEKLEEELLEKKKKNHRYLEFDKILGKENLNHINNMLNENINPFIRMNIKQSIERAVSLKLNKGIKINIPKSIYNGK